MRVVRLRRPVVRLSLTCPPLVTPLDFSLNNIKQKDIRRSLLSNGETRRSLALAVLQLLKLQQPLSNSGADISYQLFDVLTNHIITKITIIQN